MTRRELKAAALLAARGSGCTCRPNITIAGRGHVRVAHEYDCPAVRAGRHAFVPVRLAH